MRCAESSSVRSQAGINVLSICLVAALLLTGSDLRSAAQTIGTEQPISNQVADSDPILTISKRVDEVRLFFTVTDSHGKFVGALNAHDFALLDNGRPPERLYHFQARASLPLQVVLLVDISSSIKYRFPFEQKAATMLLKNILRPGVDQASIIAFGTDVRDLQSMTGDTAQLAKVLRNLHPGGETSLYDALSLAAQKFSAVTQDGVRKVIILLTDGADTTSRLGAAEAVNRIVLSEATVLVVDATVPSENGTKGQAFLEQLTSASGGNILAARQVADLKGAFRAVEKVLRNQYTISYKPSEFRADGSFRQIHLNPVKQGWKVHCREGYYAPAH